jgi:hypothetical protein
MKWLKGLLQRRATEAVTSDERRAVWIMAAVFAALSVAPAAVAYYYGFKTHRIWTGLDVFGMGDMQVYLSYVDQIKNGQWLIRNDFTTGPTHPYFSAVWLVIGLVARALHLSPLMAITLMKPVGAVLLALVAHWSLREFLARRAERLWALGLFLFGGGLGWTVNVLNRNYMVTPIDWWLPEAFAIRSAMTSPHFLVGWALLLFVLTMLFRAYRDGNWRPAAWAGAASCLLTSFHPYHAPTIAFVGGLTLVTMSLLDLRPFWQRVKALATVGAMMTPAVAYHWWLLRPERNGLSALSGNICWTPSLIYVLIGFGAFIPLAILGITMLLRRREAGERAAIVFLSTWAVSQLALIYAPTMLQRRFIQGLLLPLAAFAGVAMAHFFATFDGQPAEQRRWKRGLLLAAITFVMGLTVMWSLRNDFLMVASRLPSEQYFTASEQAMQTWMRANVPPRSVVWAQTSTSGFLPERAHVVSYMGHWSQTIDVRRKLAEYGRLLQPDVDVAWLRALLEREGIEYIYRNWRDKGYGLGLDKMPFLEVVHREGDETLFRVNLSK